MILPMVLRGSASRNSTATSRCVLPSWPLAHARTSSWVVGVPEQQHLDIGGIDVEAAGNDHVLLAVEQDDEAVLVDAAHVAGLEEQAAVLVVPEEVARLVGLLVVALHHHLAAPGKLADLALRQHLALLVEDHDLAAEPRLAHGMELVGMKVGLERAASTAFGDR